MENFIFCAVNTRPFSQTDQGGIKCCNKNMTHAYSRNIKMFFNCN